MVELFGTEKVDPVRIAEAVDEIFDLRPAAIIRDLDLRRPDLPPDGRLRPLRPHDKDLTWEQLSRLAAFKSALGL